MSVSPVYSVLLSAHQLLAFSPGLDCCKLSHESYTSFSWHIGRVLLGHGVFKRLIPLQTLLEPFQLFLVLLQILGQPLNIEDLPLITCWHTISFFLPILHNDHGVGCVTFVK